MHAILKKLTSGGQQALRPFIFYIFVFKVGQKMLLCSQSVVKRILILKVKF